MISTIKNTLFYGLIAISSSCCTIKHPLNPEQDSKVTPTIKTSLEQILDGAYCLRSTGQNKQGDTYTSYGSAVALSFDGTSTYLTTSTHVLNHPGDLININYTLVTNRTDDNQANDLSIEVVFSDVASDTSIIKTKGEIPLSKGYEINEAAVTPPLLKVGDETILVGYPYGLGKWPTRGMVSDIYQDMIVLDSTVNFGNSGGLAFVKNNSGKFYLLGQLQGCIADNEKFGCKGYAFIKPLSAVLPHWKPYLSHGTTPSHKS